MITGVSCEKRSKQKVWLMAEVRHTYLSPAVLAINWMMSFESILYLQLINKNRGHTLDASVINGRSMITSNVERAIMAWYGVAAISLRNWHRNGGRAWYLCDGCGEHLHWEAAGEIKCRLMLQLHDQCFMLTTTSPRVASFTSRRMTSWNHQCRIMKGQNRRSL